MSCSGYRIGRGWRAARLFCVPVIGIYAPPSLNFCRRHIEACSFCYEPCMNVEGACGGCRNSEYLPLRRRLKAASVRRTCRATPEYQHRRALGSTTNLGPWARFQLGNKPVFTIGKRTHVLASLSPCFQCAVLVCQLFSALYVYDLFFRFSLLFYRDL